MAETVFKQWIYPSEFEDPFWTSFEGMVGQMDASVYAIETLQRALVGGGGDISWASGGGVGWTEDFVVPIFSTGFKASLRYGPDGASRNAALNDGDCLYSVIPLSVSENVVLDLTKGNKLPNRDGVFPLCARIGNELIFRNGRRFTF
jgi:hypothetical protein